MLDVTDRRIAEEQASAAEERFRHLAERGPLVVYEYELERADPLELQARYLSPSASELLGSPMDTWRGDLETWFSLMHPDDVERMTDVTREARPERRSLEPRLPHDRRRRAHRVAARSRTRDRARRATAGRSCSRASCST